MAAKGPEIYRAFVDDADSRGEPLEADIYIWQKAGHFYFALTRTCEPQSGYRWIANGASRLSQRFPAPIPSVSALTHLRPIAVESRPRMKRSQRWPSTWTN